jgi:thiamine-phosphate diphosphorylase/hydroxyethylthiazole kinase
MINTIDLSVYLVTDSGLLPSGADLASTVASAIKGGVTIVQLREKNLETAPFVERAKQVLKVCRASNVPLLINDRVDVALAVDADGIHVGQDDMPVNEARRLLGPNKIIGVTVETVEQAIAAINAGANYIGTSAVYETTTKVHPRGVKPLGVDGVGQILSAAKEAQPTIPVVTIGGINSSNVEQILTGVESATGNKWKLSGVAVVSAIVANENPETAAKDLASKVSPIVDHPHPHSAVELKNLDALVPFLSDKSAAFVDKVAAALDRIKSSKPLVHSVRTTITAIVQMIMQRSLT